MISMSQIRNYMLLNLSILLASEKNLNVVYYFVDVIHLFCLYFVFIIKSNSTKSIRYF